MKKLILFLCLSTQANASDLSEAIKTADAEVLNHEQVLEMIYEDSSDFGTNDFCEQVLSGEDFGNEEGTICVIRGAK